MLLSIWFLSFYFLPKGSSSSSNCKRRSAIPGLERRSNFFGFQLALCDTTASFWRRPSSWSCRGSRPLPRPLRWRVRSFRHHLRDSPADSAFHRVGFFVGPDFPGTLYDFWRKSENVQRLKIKLFPLITSGTWVGIYHKMCDVIYGRSLRHKWFNRAF